MIINNVQNNIEFKEVSHDYKRNFKSSKLHKIVDAHKSSRKNYLTPLMTNNIANEIRQLKEKEISIDYMRLYNLTSGEYEESLKKIKNLIEEISERHIHSIIGIKKLIGTYKHILELFLYLSTGELIFDWKKFKSELNVFEIKFKMSAFITNFKKLNYKILCNILDKVTKDKNFSKEFLEDKEIGINLIFIWIREVLKVYFYLEKEKKISNHGEEEKTGKKQKIKINSARKIIDKQKPKIIKLGLEIADENINLKLNSQILKLSTDKNFYSSSSDIFKTIGENNSNDNKKFDKFMDNSIYLTKINDIKIYKKINPSTPQYKVKNKTDKQSNKTNLNSVNHLNKKEFRLDFDVSENNLNKDKKNLLSLPLIKYKNFHELKRFYNPQSITDNNEEITNKHYEDLDILSMKKPNSINKLVTYISFNRINTIDNDSIGNFILLSDEEFNKDKIKLEIQKKEGDKPISKRK